LIGSGGLEETRIIERLWDNMLVRGGGECVRDRTKMRVGESEI